LGGGLCGCRDAEPEWVRVVETAHSRADAARSAEERAEAFEALQRAYRAVPEGSEVQLVWVRQDLCVRLADAALNSGRPAVALDWSDTGLGLSTLPSVAVADLHRVRGEALEALGRKEEAASALHQALVVNQALMERALRGKNAEDEPE